MQWYYITEGGQQGPVSLDEIKKLINDGILSLSDYVWNETMGTEWQQVSSVPELSESVQVPPLPDLYAQTNTPPPAETIYSAGASGKISYTTPASNAFEQMKNILFRPFDIRKWFVLGVSAWLATLGEGRGYSYSNSGDIYTKEDSISTSFNEAIQYTANFWHQHSDTIITVGTIIFIFLIISGLLVAWLKSHGKFMLLDNVINDTQEISNPWHVFKQHSHSLFLWYIFFSVINLIIFSIIAGIAFISAIIPCIHANGFVPSALPGIITTGILFMIFGIITAYIRRFVEDFIIPIMYNFDMTVTEAWHKFGEIYKKNSGKFILYGLFYSCLRLLASLAVAAFILFTCCTGACLLMVPFIGTVTMLPIIIFFRLYSIQYLAQYGQEYKIT